MFPSASKTIIALGAAVLAFTAAQMLVIEPVLRGVFEAPGLPHTAARLGAYALAVAGVLGAGWWHQRRHRLA